MIKLWLLRTVHVCEASNYACVDIGWDHASYEVVSVIVVAKRRCVFRIWSQRG